MNCLRMLEKEYLFLIVFKFWLCIYFFWLYFLVYFLVICCDIENILKSMIKKNICMIKI